MYHKLAHIFDTASKRDRLIVSLDLFLDHRPMTPQEERDYVAALSLGAMPHIMYCPLPEDKVYSQTYDPKKPIIDFIGRNPDDQAAPKALLAFIDKVRARRTAADGVDLAMETIRQVLKTKVEYGIDCTGLNRLEKSIAEKAGTFLTQLPAECEKPFDLCAWTEKLQSFRESAHFTRESCRALMNICEQRKDELDTAIQLNFLRHISEQAHGAFGLTKRMGLHAREVLGKLEGWEQSAILEAAQIAIKAPDNRLPMMENIAQLRK